MARGQATNENDNKLQADATEFVLGIENEILTALKEQRKEKLEAAAEARKAAEEALAAAASQKKAIELEFQTKSEFIKILAAQEEAARNSGDAAKMASTKAALEAAELELALLDSKKTAITSVYDTQAAAAKQAAEAEKANDAELEAAKKKALESRLKDEYLNGSLYQKRQLVEYRKQEELKKQEKLKEEKAEYARKIKTLKEELKDENLSAEERAKKEAEIAEIRKKSRAATKEIATSEKAVEEHTARSESLDQAMQAADAKSKGGLQGIQAKAQAATEKADKSKAKVVEDKKAINEAEARKKQLEEKAKKEGGLSKEEAEEQAALEETLKELKDKLAKDTKEANKDEKDRALTQGLANMTNALVNGLANISKSIDSTIDSFYEAQARINARLLGTDERYSKMLMTMTLNVGLNPFVSQKKVAENIAKLVDTGVAYNVELRAYLGTLAEDIQNTFNAFDASLLKMIRLQQADTTAARLGLEISLNRLFNEYFSDTSYLSDAFDTVSSNLLTASALLGRDDSLEFEYQVQKWLGSLYALGLSQEAVSSISQGLGYLGSGDVQALESNQQLNSLLAMSATRAGLNYGELLNKGINGEETNALLKSMIVYLRDIAGNTESNVAQASYANVFSLGMSDMKALTNLTDDDIQKLYKKELDYSGMMQATQTQIATMVTREHISIMMKNLTENAVTGTALMIGSNPVTYGLWMANNIVKGLTGGINIPAIQAMGSGIDLNTDVNSLIQLGMAGAGLLGSIIAGVAGLANSLTGNLSGWGYEEFTSRGGNNTRKPSSSIDTGVSESTTMTNNTTTSGDETSDQALSDAEGEANEKLEAKKSEEEAKESVEDKIYATLAEGGNSVVGQLMQANLLLAMLSEATSIAFNRTHAYQETNLASLDTVLETILRMSGYNSADVDQIIENNHTALELAKVETSSVKRLDQMSSMMNLISESMEEDREAVLQQYNTDIQKSMQEITRLVYDGTKSEVTEYESVLTEILKEQITNRDEEAPPVDVAAALRQLKAENVSAVALTESEQYNIMTSAINNLSTVIAAEQMKDSLKDLANPATMVSALLGPSLKDTIVSTIDTYYTTIQDTKNELQTEVNQKTESAVDRLVTILGNSDQVVKFDDMSLMNILNTVLRGDRSPNEPIPVDVGDAASPDFSTAINAVTSGGVS